MLMTFVDALMGAEASHTTSVDSTDPRLPVLPAGPKPVVITAAAGDCGLTLIVAQAHAFAGGPATVLRCPG